MIGIKPIRHRDGTVSLRMYRHKLDELIEADNFAYVHWQGVAERSLLTGRKSYEVDVEIRDAYKRVMDELAEVVS